MNTTAGPNITTSLVDQPNNSAVPRPPEAKRGSTSSIIYAKSTPQRIVTPLPTVAVQEWEELSRSAEAVGAEGQGGVSAVNSDLRAPQRQVKSMDKPATNLVQSEQQNSNHIDTEVEVRASPNAPLVTMLGEVAELVTPKSLGEVDSPSGTDNRHSLDESFLNRSDEGRSPSPSAIKHQGLRLKLSRIRMPKEKVPSGPDVIESLPVSPPSVSPGSSRASNASSTPATPLKKGHRFRLHPTQNRSTPDLSNNSITTSHNARGSLTPGGILNRRPSGYQGEAVKETSALVRDYDPQTGNKMINQYMVIRELGRGCHGKVKLAVDIETGEHWAIKVVDKHARRRFTGRLALSQRLAAAEEARAKGLPVQLPNPHLEKIKREIAILKKCDHPHVVRLKEVIDDPQSEKIYLVLEYLAGGDIRWHDYSEPRRPTLSIEETHRVFRDVVCGVQYLHHQGILHRDIKPANLLWTAERRVKISDFGVSVFVGNRRKRQQSASSSSTNESDLGEEANEIELAKTAGSPAFFAPELCGVTDDDPSMFLPFNPFGTNASTGTPSSLPDARSTSDVSAGGLVSNQSSFVSEGSSVPGMYSGNPSSHSLDKVEGGTRSPRRRISDKLLEEARNAQAQAYSIEEQVVSPIESPPADKVLPPDTAPENQEVKSPTEVGKGRSPPTSPSPRRRSLVHSKSLPPIGKAIDVWAMGVTLYCFVFGRVPFIAETEFELFNVISKNPLEFPADVPIDDQLRDLFVRIMEKDPTKRITLEEIKLHPWTTADMTTEERDEWLMQTDPDVQYGDPLDVTEEEMRGAVTIVGRIRDRIRKISSSFQHLAAGLSFRRRTRSLPSVTGVEDVQTMVKSGTPRKYRADRARRRPERADGAGPEREATESGDGAGIQGSEEPDYFNVGPGGSAAATPVSYGSPQTGNSIASRSLSPPGLKFGIRRVPSSNASGSPTRAAAVPPAATGEISSPTTPSPRSGGRQDNQWYRWDRPPAAPHTAWTERGEGSVPPKEAALWGRDLSPGVLPSRMREIIVSSSDDDDGDICGAEAEMERIRNWNTAYGKSDDFNDDGLEVDDVQEVIQGP
ncbi:hypothetical protein HDV00_003853 [Rhizophlyctis rosea]|nr:hypothetical protein HDV00_003853 [Rhizophlyctis rosea]